MADDLTNPEPCVCTLVRQDESCPVGYPSLLCSMCGGIGSVRSDADDYPTLRALSAEKKANERIILKEIDNRDAWEGAFGDLYALIMGQVPEWSNLYGIADALRDVESALSAKLQEPVEVKSLEWVPTIISDKHLRDVASGLDGLIAYEVGVEQNYVLVNGRGLGIKQLGNFSSLEEAKAAAQSDYDARVRAMLADRKGG